MVSCLRAGEGVGKRSPEHNEVLYGIQHSSHRGCAGLGSSLGLGLVMQCWTEALLNGMTECLCWAVLHPASWAAGEEQHCFSVPFKLLPQCTSSTEPTLPPFPLPEPSAVTVAVLLCSSSYTAALCLHSTHSCVHRVPPAA